MSMSGQSLGLIETVGLAAAIEAADAAIKSANVELLGYESAKGNGLHTVKLVGDVGAVNAAVDAGVAAASRIGEVYAYKVLARTAEGLEAVIVAGDNVGTNAAQESKQQETKQHETKQQDAKQADVLLQDVVKETPIAVVEEAKATSTTNAAKPSTQSKAIEIAKASPKVQPGNASAKSAPAKKAAAKPATSNTITTKSSATKAATSSTAANNTRSKSNRRSASN